MRNNTSYDEGGPLTPLGDMAFSAETGLPGGRQTFKLPTFSAASDESKVVVEYNGLYLTDLGTRNDHYGFGSSAETALSDAMPNIKKLKGCNVNIRVITTLTKRLCLPSEDKPFYTGSQRIHHIPMTWTCETQGCSEQKDEFVVWENGHPTDDAKRFLDVISDLCAGDAAPARLGDLRSITRRKTPATREDFLIFASENK